MRQERLREQLTGGSVLLEEYRLDPLLDRWEEAFFSLGVRQSTGTIKWLSSSASLTPKQGAPTLHRAVTKAGNRCS
jgi:hypothetical protein